MDQLEGNRPVSILADSVNVSGVRLTTFRVVIPKCLLAQLNTHRALSRNAASSRAVPIKAMIEKVRTNPFVPTVWGKNKKGMWSNEEVNDPKECARIWLEARNHAVRLATELANLDLHKQTVNRLLEPFLYSEVVLSGTDWKNFLFLRTNYDVQPELREMAIEIRKCLILHTPTLRLPGQLHLPFITMEERNSSTEDTLVKISSARCARVSYYLHDGSKSVDEDVALCDRLQSGGHYSPMEHPAYALFDDKRIANFRGWEQYRKRVRGEDIQSSSDISDLGELEKVHSRTPPTRGRVSLPINQ